MNEAANTPPNVAGQPALENVVDVKLPNDSSVFLLAEALRGIGAAIAMRKYR